MLSQKPSQSLDGRARTDDAFLRAEPHLLTAHAQLVLFSVAECAVQNAC